MASIRTSLFKRMILVMGVKRRLHRVVDAADDPSELAAIVKKQRRWQQPDPPRGVARSWQVETIDIDGFDLHLGVNPSEPGGRVILFFHGGGFLFGPFRPDWTFLTGLASSIASDFALLTYPKAPEHQVDGTLKVARLALIELMHRYGASNVVLVGSSAGGGIAVSAMVALRQAGHPQPDRAVLISPSVDMTMADDATHLEDDDIFLSIEFIRAAGEIYAQPFEPDDSRVSPMFADLGGLAPLLVLVGDREILLPSIERFAASAVQAGTDVELIVGSGQQHAWPHAPTPEGKAAVERIAAFVLTPA